ncbi:MAG: carboxymuconolactone decarboxylase, partial [Verrucomicrobia bacterium]|nr:carboxymuconolactone decarboxylase [Cytophagales bacterium]
LYNKYVDGLASVTPTNPEFYQKLGDRIVNNGYNRPKGGFDAIKKQNESLI